MSTHTTFASTFQNPTYFSQVLAKHPYGVDTTAPFLAQIEAFVVCHLQHLHMHQDPDLDDVFADCLSSLAHAVAHHATNGGPYSCNDSALVAQQRGRLDVVLAQLVAHNFHCDATSAYYGSMSDTPWMWSLLDQHGFVVKAGHKKSHWIWQDVVERGRTKEAAFLLGKGVLPAWNGQNQAPSYNPYPKDANIFHLVEKAHSFAVLTLIPEEILRPLVGTVNSKGETPLHYAARHLLPDYVQLLLQWGADKNAQTLKGKYPADMIKRSKSRTQALDNVLALLGGKSQQSPDALFLHACKALDVDTARRAQLQGADVAALCMAGAMDLIFAPIAQGRLKKARAAQKILLQWLLDQHIGLGNAQGQNALHLAVANGAVECVALLVAHRPDMIVAVDNNGVRPAQTPTTHTDRAVLWGEELWGEETADEMQQDTQMRIAEVFHRASAPIHVDDFPTARLQKKHALLLDTWVVHAALSEAVADVPPLGSATRVKKI